MAELVVEVLRIRARVVEWTAFLRLDMLLRVFQLRHFQKRPPPIQRSRAKPAAYSRHEDVWHWGSNPSLLYQAFVCATKYTMHPCRQDLSDSLYMLQAIHHVKDGT